MKLEGTNFGHIQKKMHENKYSCKQLIWYTPIFDEKTSYIYNGTASKSLCRVPSFHHGPTSVGLLVKPVHWIHSSQLKVLILGCDRSGKTQNLLVETSVLVSITWLIGTAEAS